jgi:hypothetical protein
MTTPSPSYSEEWVSLKHAVSLCGIAYKTLYDLVRAGKIQSKVKVVASGGKYLVNLPEVRAIKDQELSPVLPGIAAPAQKKRAGI